MSSNSTGQLEIKTRNRVVNGKIKLDYPSYWANTANETQPILPEAIKCLNGESVLDCKINGVWTKYV